MRIYYYLSTWVHRSLSFSLFIALSLLHSTLITRLSTSSFHRGLLAFAALLLPTLGFPFSCAHQRQLFFLRCFSCGWLYAYCKYYHSVIVSWASVWRHYIMPVGGVTASEEPKGKLYPGTPLTPAFIFRRLEPSLCLAVEALSFHFPGRPAVRTLTHISRYAIFLHLVDGFQWNLPKIHVFIMWVGIAQKVFKVRGQSWPDLHLSYNSGSRHTLGRCGVDGTCFAECWLIATSAQYIFRTWSSLL